LRRLRRCVAGMLLLSLSTLASAQSIWVVAHQDAPAADLSRRQVADLFLGRLQGLPLTPFDQAEAGLRESFYRAVAGLYPHSVRAYWAKQVFTGRGRPPAMLSASETERKLRENRACVTYVPAGSLPAGSRVLMTLNLEEK
jgi:hypothetical protein